MNQSIARRLDYVIPLMSWPTRTATGTQFRDDEGGDAGDDESEGPLMHWESSGRVLGDDDMKISISGEGEG